MDELARLIEEQRLDDCSYVWPEKDVISLDAVLDNSNRRKGDYGIPQSFESGGALDTRVTLDPRVTHGTESTYVNYGCRCKPCTKAASEASLLRKHKQAERELWHGTLAGYRYYGCRKKCCRRPAVAAMRRWRRIKAGHPLQKQPKVCPGCGEKFYPGRFITQIYCSVKCRQRACRARRELTTATSDARIAA